MSRQQKPSCQEIPRVPVPLSQLVAILGYKARTLGKMLWALGQICLRVIGSLRQVEPAREGRGLAAAGQRHTRAGH